MRKFVVFLLVGMLIILSACTVKEETKEETNEKSIQETIYEKNKESYTDAYIQLLHTFADYCGVEVYEVEFSVCPVVKVVQVTDSKVVCNGGTKLYSFKAGEFSGEFYCDSKYVRTSLDGTVPVIHDGEYPISEDGRLIFDEYISCKINEPIRFASETESKLGYTTEDIIQIYVNRLKILPTEENKFEYSVG